MILEVGGSRPLGYPKNEEGSPQVSGCLSLFLSIDNPMLIVAPRANNESFRFLFPVID